MGAELQISIQGLLALHLCHIVRVNGRFVDDSGTWGSGGMFNAIARLSPKVPEAYEAACEAGDLQLADLHLVPISGKLLFSIPLCFTCIDTKVFGHYVVTLLNLTPIFGWYITRFVLRMDTKKTCVTKRLECSHYYRHHSGFNYLTHNLE